MKELLDEFAWIDDGRSSHVSYYRPSVTDVIFLSEFKIFLIKHAFGEQTVILKVNVDRNGRLGGANSYF